MIATVAIGGTKKVLVNMGNNGSGNFIQREPVMIRVTGIISDEATPLAVREGMVGVNLRTLLTSDDVGVPGARGAFAEDTIEAVRAAGKAEIAEALQGVVNDPMDAFVFEPGTFEVVA